MSGLKGCKSKSVSLREPRCAVPEIAIKPLFLDSNPVPLAHHVVIWQGDDLERDCPSSPTVSPKEAGTDDPKELLLGRVVAYPHHVGSAQRPCPCAIVKGFWDNVNDGAIG